MKTYGSKYFACIIHEGSYFRFALIKINHIACVEKEMKTFPDFIFCRISYCCRLIASIFARIKSKAREIAAELQINTYWTADSMKEVFNIKFSELKILD